jgi:FdhE protein
MTGMSAIDLREAWADLLRRRPSLADTLAAYDPIVDAWQQDAGHVRALAWSAAQCAGLWERGVPLLAEAPIALDADEIEAWLGPAMEAVAAIRPGEAPALQRFAEAWDGGHVRPEALLPAKGRVGTVSEEIGLDAGVVAFLAAATLRPALERAFSACRDYRLDGVWELGTCPFCGGPPGFGDLVEDGRRRLACAVCGGAWIFARVRCPFCGQQETGDLVRLEAGAAAEQGYIISACRRCHGYLKELDRRVRWNGGPPVVEDWGSPHLDLIATRAGYWRPVPTLIQLASPA